MKYMEKEKNNETESSGKVHFIIMAFVRIMLVLALIQAQALFQLFFFPM